MNLFEFFKNIFGKKQSVKKVDKGRLKKHGKVQSKPLPLKIKRKNKAKKSSLKRKVQGTSRKKAVVKAGKKGWAKKAKRGEREIGIITHYFGKISVGVIRLKATLKVGDKIHIRGAHDDFVQTVRSMQSNHINITSASRGKEVGIKVVKRVHENDRVYKING